MVQLGKIDISIYRCVTDNIATDELIITEKQIEHILQRHPKDFKNAQDIFRSVIEAVSLPDYIVESDKPNSAFILKVLNNSEKSRLIVRLKTCKDPENYKNSVITFQKVREREWNRILRNKKILYKSE